MKIFGFPIVAVTCFLAGCDSNTGPGYSGVIMPLAIGNEWHYLLEHYDSTGTKVVATGPTEVILTDTLQVEGNTWYRDSVTRLAYANTDDGLYEGYKNFIYDWIDRLLLPFPASVGTSRIDTEVRYRLTWRITLADRDTLITVPAGSFLCHKYYEDRFSRGDESELTHRIIHFYAPNKGRICSQEYHMNDNGRWILDHRYLLTRLVRK